MIFCRHYYEKINKFIIPSMADMLHAVNKAPNTTTCFTRKYVTDYRCIKCGKIKRFVEKTASY